MSLSKNSYKKLPIKPPPHYRSPSLVNIDLKLDSRIARVEKRGYLSQRLSHFKKQICSTEINLAGKQTMRGRLLLGLRKGSLQLIQKQRKCRLPVQENEKQKPFFSGKLFDNTPYCFRKSTMKTKRSQVNNEEEMNQIDKVFIKMIREDDEVNLKSHQYERYLTGDGLDIIERYNRRSAERNQSGKESKQANRILGEISEEFQRRKRLLGSGSGLKQQLSRGGSCSARKVVEKEVEYGGWETPLPNDLDL